MNFSGPFSAVEIVSVIDEADRFYIQKPDYTSPKVFGALKKKVKTGF